MTCNDFGQSSIVFGHGLNPQALLLRHSPLKRTLALAYPPKPLLFTLLGIGACHMLEQIGNCRGIELSSRDFKTVAISVTRAKLYCINTWFACTSPSPEEQSPAGNLASAYPPKPLLYTLLGVGACDMLEQIGKLSRYRTIEQGLQNCCNISHSSKVILY